VDILDGGCGFQGLEMYLAILGKKDVRPQYAVRVGELLDPPHHIRRLLTPFPGDKGRHIDAGSVFGFQRTIVFIDHQIDKFLHEGRIAFPILFLIEPREQHEMQISVHGMAGHAGHVSMLYEQRCQVMRGLRKHRRRKAHIFYDQHRALRAQLSHQAQKSFAHMPGQLDRLFAA
jgi:hypothetical protein